MKRLPLPPDTAASPETHSCVNCSHRKEDLCKITLASRLLNEVTITVNGNYIWTGHSINCSIVSYFRLQVLTIFCALTRTIDHITLLPVFLDHYCSEDFKMWNWKLKNNNLGKDFPVLNYTARLLKGIKDQLQIDLHTFAELRLRFEPKRKCLLFFVMILMEANVTQIITIGDTEVHEQSSAQS